MSQGRAERFGFDTAQQLADLIGSLGPSQALALGALPLGQDEYEVNTKARLNGAPVAGVVARSNEFFTYRSGAPAWALLDFDMKGMPEPMVRRLEATGGVWAALVSIIPELAGAARVERQSTSAGLYRTDTKEKFPGSGGRHFYIAVQDSADIERFLKTLHERCWLAGFGWMMVGAGGQLLERSVVDRVVGGPERLSFEGAPVLIPPIAQDAEARRPIGIEGNTLDTIAACPPLTITDQIKLDELRKAEKHRLAPDAAKERKVFVDRQSERLAARTGMDAASARKMVERWVDGVLLPDIILPFDDPDLAGIMVADVLAEPARFEGETLADPLEGIDYGRGKAKVMRRTDRSLWIHSFAHGRTVYELKLDFKSAKAVMEKATADAAAQVYVDLTLAGDFAADEIEMLRNIAAEISGIGKRALDRKLKEARRTTHRTTSNVGELHATELLQLFNAQYAVVNENGKARVYEMVRDPHLDRNVLIRSRFEDFKKLHMNHSVEVIDSEGNVREKPAGDYWLSHEARRQYLGGVVFDPTGNAPPDQWNLWTGFAVEPAPGDWSLMREHIHKVICSGNDEHYEYLINMIALLFQQPSRPAEVAVVLRGKQGCGKGVLCKFIGKAWGQHGVHVFSTKHLVGNFNLHLRDCVFLFADEAFFAGDRQNEGALKGLITEPVLPIEGKGQDVVFAPNMLHVYMSSNSEWVIPVSHDARRYFVLDVSDSRIGNRKYFKDLYKQMEGGGVAAMVYDLLQRDISQFDPRVVLVTKALEEQKQLSLDSLDRWWRDVLEREFVWESRHGVSAFGRWYEFCSTELLSRSYLQWCQKNQERRPKSREELGRRMKEMYAPTRPSGDQIIGEVEVRGPMADDGSLVVKANRPPGYAVLTIDEARAKFSEIRGVTGSWSADNAESGDSGEGLDFNSDSKEPAWSRGPVARGRAESVH
jgi:hypothetical protein